MAHAGEHLPDGLIQRKHLFGNAQHQNGDQRADHRPDQSLQTGALHDVAAAGDQQGGEHHHHQHADGQQ